jgi:homoserine kinase type II
VHHSEDVQQVLRPFPIAAGTCQAVDSDGFSGARLWRVTDGERQYCLRRWPEETNPARVLSINTVLARANLPFIGRPVVGNSLQSLAIHAGYVWTLQPWMPGRSISKLPPPRELLRNAVQALALFHRTTASFRFDNDCHLENWHEMPEAVRQGKPQGLQSRTEVAATHLQRKLNGLRIAHIPGRLADLQPRRERLIPLFLEVAPRLLDESQAALRWEVPLQACIRDIHAGHVLFTGDQVTGLIDFDAMRVDSIATDLARLLGSYCGDDFDLWDLGLSAYEEIRPLSKDERDLVVHYDRLAVLLTGLQWLEWILLEGKEFELARVLPRIDATLERLEHLRNRLRTGPGLIA